jgi:hypothetical protein
LLPLGGTGHIVDTPDWLISAYALIPGQFSATSKNRVHN